MKYGAIVQTSYSNFLLKTLLIHCELVPVELDKGFNPDFECNYVLNISSLKLATSFNSHAFLYTEHWILKKLDRIPRRPH